MNFLYFFLLYQSTVLSSHAEDGHQMYFRGSVVGKSSIIGIGISPTSPLRQTCQVSRTLCETHAFAVNSRISARAEIILRIFAAQLRIIFMPDFFVK